MNGLSELPPPELVLLGASGSGFLLRSPPLRCGLSKAFREDLKSPENALLFLLPLLLSLFLLLLCMKKCLFIFSGDYLVDVSKFIRKGKNIDLDDCDLVDPNHEQQLMRVPLWLMPREEGDRRKKEFKVSACAVHQSGAFLLQEQDMEHPDLPESAMHGTAIRRYDC